MRFKIVIAVLITLFFVGCTLFQAPTVDEQIARLDHDASRAFGKGDYYAAAAGWNKALALARRSGRERDAARFLIQRSKADEHRGLYEQAQSDAEQGLSAARSISDEDLEAGARIAFGTALLRQGTYQEALAELQQALTIARRRHDARLQSESLRQLGAISQGTGDYGSAQSYYASALKSARAASNAMLEAKALNNLGGLFRLRGEYQAALDHYQQSLTLRQHLRDRPGEGRVSGNLCLTYLRLGDDAAALNHCRRALQIARQTGDRAREANHLNTLGAIYRSRGALNRALSYYRDSLEIKEVLSDRAGAGRSLNNIAEIYWQTNRHRQALDYFSRSLALRVAIGDRSGESAVHQNMALVSLELEQYNEALGHFEKALAIQNEVGQPELLWRIFDGLARTHQALGNSQLAIFFGKHAVNSIQSMRAEIGSLDKTLQRSFLEDKSRVYRQLADRLIDEGRLLEAQQILALLKEDEYFDYLRGASDDASGTQAVLSDDETRWMERYRAISKDLVSLGSDYSALKRNKLSGSPLSPEETARLQQLEQDLEIARRAFDHFLRELERTYERESRGKVVEFGEKDLRSLLGFQATLKRLGPGVVLIHYLILDNKLRIILTGSNTAIPPVHIDSPIDRKALYRLIHDFRVKKLTNPRLSPLPEAYALYRHLIEPIAAALQRYGAKTLMVYMDGALRYLPLPALYDGSQYLVQRYAVVMYTVAAKANLLLPPSVDWRVAGLGISEPAPGFGSLPAVADELDSIVKESETDALGVLPGSTYLDREFTAQRLQQLLYEGYPVVHLATHFKFQPGPAENSFMLMGEGKRFTLDTFKVGDYPLSSVELLTLSACETALGSEDADGREIEGFGTLAQQRGAAAVLATLWEVADRSTALLMERFYILKQQDRLTKAEALRRAQLAFLEGGNAGDAVDAERARGVGLAMDDREDAYQAPPGAPYAHPFYWAPFVLLGNWL